VPFPKQEKHEFTLETISTIRPGQPGIYGIFNQTRCIYIGKSEDIRECLLQHARGESEQSVSISKKKPQYWLASIVAKSQLDFWERILLQELKPVCRPQPGPGWKKR
jgi:hypothetical protein